MFKSFFSFGKNVGMILGTLCFVLILGSYYFFVFIPDNQRDVEERRFKSLQKIENNIHDKLDNSIALLNDLLINDSTNRAGTSNYMTTAGNANFKLVPISTTPDSLRKDSLCIYTFNGTEITVRLIKGKRMAGLKYNIRQFIDPLLPRDFFDEYLLLSTGKIIYQTFPSGVNEIAADSLHSKKSAFASNSIKDVHLTGAGYKLFAQQLKLGERSELTVVGLLQSKRYQAEITRLPENKSLLLLTIAVAIIFSLPWIKLYQMGSQDRLTVTDGAFSFAVAMLLMSLLFFAFFKYNVLLRPNDPDKMKVRLADSIGNRFMTEITTAYAKLSSFDTLRHTLNLKSDVQNLGTDRLSAGNATSIRAVAEGLRKIDSTYHPLAINQVFWLTKSGVEKYNWTKAVRNSPHGNYADRSYFNQLVAHPFLLNNDTSRPFYVDQILSRITGSFTTVLSTPSHYDSLAVVAVSFDLKSLIKPLITEGFSYAIVNKQGKVLYHSDTKRNLNENLADEFQESGKLNSAIIAESNSFFKTKYMGTEHSVYVKPLANLPFHIVVMEDRGIRNSMDVKIFSFITCMLFGLYLFLIVQLVIFFLASSKRSFFKKQYFDITWIGPHLSFARNYDIAIVFNFSIIVLITIFYFTSSFFEYLFILLLCSIAVTLFMNVLFLRSFPKSPIDKCELKRRANVALSIIIVAINVAALVLLDSCVVFLLFEFLMLLLASGYLFSIKWLRLGLKKTKSFLKISSWDFSYSFSLMVFSRIIITSGLPVAFFYTSAYDYESQLISRYRHDQVIKQILEKNPNPSAATLDSVYTDGGWIAKAKLIESKNANPDTLMSPEESKTIKIFNLITGLKSSYKDGLDAFYTNPKDGLTGFNGLFDKEGTRSVHKLPNGRLIEISSGNLRYYIPNMFREGTWKGFVYWMIFISSLLLFWLCLHRIIRKLFALNLPSDYGWDTIDQVILTTGKLNSLLFIIGPPGSGKLKKMKKLLNDGEIKGKNGVSLWYHDHQGTVSTNVLVADMILIPPVENAADPNDPWEKLKAQALAHDKLIIVNHFEYDMKNPVTNNIKLNFLESVLQKNKSKLIIISTVHPVNFLDSLNQLDKYKEGELRKPEHDLERWHVLLGHFRIVIEKLETISFTNSTNEWEQTLLSETSDSHFLNTMQKPVLKKINELYGKDTVAIDGDSLAFKMQITAHYFYMYIWQSLTKEEKFLLYDLAEDGLVNPYDDYNLILLINKGLIVRPNGCLRLFNKGFRNFILTAIGNTEALKLKEQIKDNGNWSKLRIPLLIVIASVLVFLFTSQKEAYSKAIAYLTILSAAVPAVIKFFSLFGSNSQKSG